MQGLNWAWQELSLRNSVVTCTFIYAEFFNTTVFISVISYQTADTTKSFPHLDQQVVSHVASIGEAKCLGWPEGILGFSIICKNVEKKLHLWFDCPPLANPLLFGLPKTLKSETTFLTCIWIKWFSNNKFWFHYLRLLSCSFYLNEFLYKIYILVSMI